MAARSRAPSEWYDGLLGDIKSWFQVSAPTARGWLHDWVDDGFLEPVGTEEMQRVRRYRLSREWREMIERTIEAAS